MANTKISALPAASALDGTEEFAGVQSGSNVKITGNQISTFLGSPVKHNPEGTGTFDLDDIDAGSMQIAYGDCTNAPTATSTDAFMIFCITDSAAGGKPNRRQIAIQITGTAEGAIYERSRTLTVWSGWDSINV